MRPVLLRNMQRFTRPRPGRYARPINDLMNQPAMSLDYGKSHKSVFEFFSKNGITKVRHVTQLDPLVMLCTPGVGRRTVEAIQKAVTAAGKFMSGGTIEQERENDAISTLHSLSIEEKLRCPIADIVLGDCDKEHRTCQTRLKRGICHYEARKKASVKTIGDLVHVPWDELKYKNTCGEGILKKASRYLATIGIRWPADGA